MCVCVCVCTDEVHSIFHKHCEVKPGDILYWDKDKQILGKIWDGELEAYEQTFSQLTAFQKSKAAEYHRCKERGKARFVSKSP